jgi:multidrug resistance efflux pump
MTMTTDPRESIAAEVLRLRAEVERLSRHGDPAFYVTGMHQAERAAKATAANNDGLRAKLQAANLRANAAEARASAEQKKREDAEAEAQRLRSLIGRYINHVSDEEGSDFLRAGFFDAHWLSDDEIAELKSMRDKERERAEASQPLDPAPRLG